MIDRILYNANLYTLNPQQPRATALALRGETILAVGSNDDMRRLAGPNTVQDNLEGRFVMPGLVDAHIHWEHTAKAHFSAQLIDIPSLAATLEAIASFAEKSSDEWIIGSGWLQDTWEDVAYRFPTAADLDRVTGARPAYLRAKSGHAAWVNSAALERADINAETPDPPGGRIGRGPDGAPDGVLYESPAMRLVADCIPSLTPERLAEMMRVVQAEAWRYGLTGLHDYDDPSCMAALQILREQGKLGLRIVKQINDPYIDHAHALGIRTGFGDTWLRIGALKIFADGALGPRTATMLASYEGEPDNYGVVVTEKAHMHELVSRATRLGLPATIHAIGDRAMRDVLDIFAAVRAEEATLGIPRAARRHRIEHVQVLHPDDIGRLAELDLIASMQPIHAISDWRLAERYWGARSAYSYHWRAQLDAGTRLVFGSDAPIDPFDTRKGLYAALTRQDLTGQPEGGWYPEACITLSEALAAYTTGPAYAAGLEAISGQLRPGYLADLTVLDRNPFDSEPAELLDMAFVGTMVGGAWQHRTFD
ncbi:MAG: amidohydrolase [Anaerolineales bacterium]